jgi:DNA-binding LacI/PurR family transcriptional regulator
LTLRDVAAELGVSAKTVSNAYSHPDQLSAGLRAQILATAAWLGYPGPNPVAAGLRAGRVGAIGVVYANRLSYAFDDPAARELLAGMTSVAESAGAGLLLLPGSSDAQKRIAGLNAAVIDGLIAYSLADDDPMLAAAITRHLPLVVIDQPRPDRLAHLEPNIPWVGIDDHTAAAQIAYHLLTLGHRQFGVVSFGLRRSPARGLVDLAAQRAADYAVTRDRLAGYRAALERHQLDWAQVPVFQGTDSTPAEGAAGAAAILGRTPRPTALLCLSDRLAEGALQATSELGLRVPDDLSIVGFDDAATAATLGLTTVHQPTRTKGEQAASALLARLDGSQATTAQTMPAELIIRSSTGQAPQPPKRHRGPNS